MHAAREAALLEDGSDQDDAWGADWYADTQAVGFESFINIRPLLGNRALEIQDAGRRALVDEIVREKFQ